MGEVYFSVEKNMPLWSLSSITVIVMRSLERPGIFNERISNYLEERWRHKLCLEVSCFLSALTSAPAGRGGGGRAVQCGHLFSRVSTPGGGCRTESPKVNPESREASRF